MSRRWQMGAATLIVAALAAGCGGGKSSAPTTVTAASPSRPTFAGQPVLADAVAADFALRDQRGALIRLSAQRGRVVLLTFLYTHCRDVCPLIAEHLQSALTALGPERDRVRVLAVSVDPAGDTAKSVRAFVTEHRLGPQFSYLTGTRPQLQPVWQAYNVLSTPRNEQVVDHSAPTLLIDQKGRPRVYYDSSFTAAPIAHDVRLLLRG
jgi:protein SCO1/2